MMFGRLLCKIGWHKWGPWKRYGKLFFTGYKYCLRCGKRSREITQDADYYEKLEQQIEILMNCKKVKDK